MLLAWHGICVRCILHHDEKYMSEAEKMQSNFRSVRHRMLNDMKGK